MLVYDWSLPRCVSSVENPFKIAHRDGIEHGPCQVNPDGQTTVLNPYSWNNLSNSASSLFLMSCLPGWLPGSLAKPKGDSDAVIPLRVVHPMCLGRCSQDFCLDGHGHLGYGYGHDISHCQPGTECYVVDL